jgi:hypothetical protein
MLQRRFIIASLEAREMYFCSDLIHVLVGFSEGQMIVDHTEKQSSGSALIIGSLQYFQ